MRRVLIDQNEPLRVLHQDIKSVQNADDLKLAIAVAFDRRFQCELIRFNYRTARVSDPSYNVVAALAERGPELREFTMARFRNFRRCFDRLGRTRCWRAEFFLPIAASTRQRSPNGIDHRFAHRSWIAKPDFAFGGMNVHIHGCRIETQKKESNGKLPFHECRVITLAQRGGDHRAFHGAAIYEDKLWGAG